MGSVHNYMKRTCEEDINRIDLDLVAKCLCELKCGKAAGPDGIEPEHLLYAHPIVMSLLTFLFNSIVHYGERTTEVWRRHNNPSCKR